MCATLLVKIREATDNVYIRVPIADGPRSLPQKHRNCPCFRGDRSDNTKKRQMN